MAAFRRFWMVCRQPQGPASKTEPRTRYPSLADARAVARDLASQSGHPFVVLEAAELVLPTDSLSATLI